MSIKLKIQPTARLLKERGYLVVGPRNYHVLDCVINNKPLKVTSTGEVRKHNFSDLESQGLLKLKKDFHRGEMVPYATFLAKRAFKEGKLVKTKLPPKGYKKVQARRGKKAA